MKEQKNISDLSMNSINIFDFMMDDQFKKKQDAQALDQIYARELQAEVRTRREKLKNINYTLDPGLKKKQLNQKNSKKIILPDWHFYDNRDLLQDLLQKEQDYEAEKNNRNGEKPAEPLEEAEEEIK